MKPISNARIVIIVLVTLVSIFLTLPTVRYYLWLGHQPAAEGERPIAESNRPSETQIEALAAWKQRNPEIIAWEERNQEYVTWEREHDQRLTKAIPLGLDLRGGVDLTLSLDREAMLRQKLDQLREHLRRDLEAEKLSVQFIEEGAADTIQLRAVNPADAQTAANLINTNYEGVIDRSISASALAEGPVSVGLHPDQLRNEFAQDLQGAMKAISERVNALGVTQPKIAVQGTDRLRLQVPGEKDPDRLIRNVIKPANLEFHLVAENEDEYIGPDGKAIPGRILPPGTAIYPGKVVIGKDETTGEMRYGDRDYLLMKKVEVAGSDLRSARVTFDQSDPRDPIQVSLEFKPDGTKSFAELTTKYGGQTPLRAMAILLDGVVRSAPTLNVPITDGRAVISGGFNDQEATELSQILKAGQIAPLKIETKRAVGATLGAESVMTGVRTLIWGTLIVAVFMIAYYGTAGMIAVAAMMLNVLIIFAMMALSKATLTLSGIGGILLTVGMAVDANVLIYERIREEIANGKSMRQAIGLGFNRAFSVILDSNLTTLVTAMVLLQFTEGSVFGFALTMTFGLIANLFTGLTVTYTLLVLWHNWRGSLSLGKLKILPETNIDFIGMRKATIVLSMIVILVAGVMLVARGGLKMGIDFAGGVSADVRTAGALDVGDMQLRLDRAGMGGGSVTQIVGEQNAYLIDVPLVANEGGDLDTQVTEDRLRGIIAEVAPNSSIVSVDSLGSQSGLEFSMLAWTVVVLASGAILIYLWFRFELIFGVAAVIALVHDLLIVVLLAQLWGVEISLDAVAALMVLMGTSVNDTIVIFDRLREDNRLVFGKSFRELCNLAMNQSLSRTLITNGTILFVSLALLIFGGPGLAPFAKIMVLGSIVGTYSTDFIATPLVYMWNEYRGDRVRQQLAAKKKKVEAAQPIRATRRQQESR